MISGFGEGGRTYCGFQILHILVPSGYSPTTCCSGGKRRTRTAWRSDVPWMAVAVRLKRVAGEGEGRGVASVRPVVRVRVVERRVRKCILRCT